MSDVALPGLLEPAAHHDTRTGLVLWLVATHGLTERQAAREIDLTSLRDTHLPEPFRPPPDLDTLETPTMIQTKTCHVPVCDGCGARDDDEYEVHQPTEADARSRAEEMDWTRTDDGRDLCVRCVCAAAGHQWDEPRASEDRDGVECSTQWCTTRGCGDVRRTPEPALETT